MAESIRSISAFSIGLRSTWERILSSAGEYWPNRLVGAFGCFDLLREIAGQFNFETAGEGGFPCDQLPLACVPAILPALYEGCVDLHLGSEQMLPSVPSGIPDLVENSRIDPELQASADVAVKGTVRIELTFAQWRMEPPPLPLWQKRNDPPCEKRLCVARQFAGNQQRAEPTIGEECRRVRILQQCVVAGPQSRVAKDVECALE